MNEYSQFFKVILKVILALLLVCSPILIFNTIVDPYGVFFNFYKKKSIESNKRYQKMKFILNNPEKYDSFIFGSSRVGALIADSVPGGVYYNMTYSVGLPHDHFQDIEYMIKNGIKIKNLIIGLDNISLLDNPRIAENDLLRKKYPVSLNEKYSFYKSYLLNLPDWNFVKLIFKDKPNKVNFNSANVHQTSSDLNLQKIKRVTDSVFSIPFSFYNNQSDIIGNIKEISKIVEIAKANNINIIWFIHPLHHITYMNINLEKYFQSLKELSNIIDFHDFSYLNSVTLNNLNYYETSHYHEEVGNLIIARLFNRNDVEVPDDFGFMANSETVETLIYLHRQSLDEYFEVTKLNHNAQPFFGLSPFNNSKLSISANLTINGNTYDQSNEPINVSIPWIKINSSKLTDLVYNNYKLFVIIDDQRMEVNKSSSTEASPIFNDSSSNSIVNNCIIIPTTNLRNGIHQFAIQAISPNMSSFMLSDAVIKVNIIHKEEILANRELDSITQSIEFSVDFINGRQLSNFEMNIKPEYLNIQGYAFDRANNSTSGGVIVILNNTSFLSQRAFTREVFSKILNKSVTENSGWGITIPCTSLRPGINELTFKVLNYKQNAYYSPSYKIILDNKTIEPTQILKNLKVKLNEKTNYYTDWINSTFIDNSNTTYLFDMANLNISGWAIDKSTQNVASNVVVEIDGIPYLANYGLDRPDVAKSLNNERYLKSGWRLTIPAQIIGEGEHYLTVKIISGDNKSYYNTENKIRFITKSH